MKIGALFLICYFGWTSGQNFRSILIERACAKRPELEFCADFTTPSPITTPSPSSSSSIPLVLPPNPSTIPPLAPTTVKLKVASTTPSPSTASESDVDFETSGNTTTRNEKEKLGSLVRLPKPLKSSKEIAVENVLKVAGAADENEEKKVVSPNGTSVSIEDDKGVLVFVSEYCVVEREHFVKSCNGDIPKPEIDFCKTYPSACVSTNGVIPVISYCQRYYKHYPKHCKKQLVAKEALQFCFAFEQFCLPELQHTVQKPKSSLRKCEDVLPEARKVCNPFPNPKDTFNLLRCTHFLTNCKKYVDWL
ncbi:unnamed protein product [Caenorhabditis bovis]|uniref:DUF19 domain-containing protein n=1 Tax=Caenorhabditis bovis TaxID=2654633 RepID=A0A8S1EA46_9PELO|nr:unnamed protein product [Caenorhabditis bovis]